MKEPLVSIVIPTYGGGDYLQRTVNSVLNPTYKNIEVIVVDDNGVRASLLKIHMYSIAGQIYFSEITFSPCRGMSPFEPNEWDSELGN